VMGYGSASKGGSDQLTYMRSNSAASSPHRRMPLSSKGDADVDGPLSAPRAERLEADGNGADLADWATSTRAAVELGEEFSQHLPITDPDAFNDIQRAYTGPVVAVVDANTFSCGDLFAAGIADHGIGQIISVNDATGAGGANVWTSDDIQYAYHAANHDLPPIPPGISFTISVRRMTRTSQSAGLAVEDVGVTGDDRYEMTYQDLLNGNPDLAEFCTQLLVAR
jgi:hypothetical protein